MLHEMKLHKEPFLSIKNGTKTIEMRLYDEKRRKINVGDCIKFTYFDESILCEVVALHKYDSFKELYECFPKVQLGYKEDEISSYKDMELYYKEEEIKKYGVIGIEIRLK